MTAAPRLRPTPAVHASVTLVDVLAARAEHDPDHVCLEVAGRSLTAAAWAARSARLSRDLRDRGVRAGDRVLVVFDEASWDDYAVAFMAVLAAGAVAVPLNAAHPELRLAEIAHDCRPVAQVARHGAPSPPHLPVVRPRRADAGVPGPGEALAELASSRCLPQDPAQIIYTSGTEGRQKGVLADHDNLAYGHALAPRPRPLAHSTHVVHAYPIGTNAAQSMLATALTAAATVVPLPRFDPRELCAAVERADAATVFLVPATAAQLLADPVARAADLSRVPLVGSTGSALAPALALGLAEMFPQAVVVNTYTSTEAAPAQTTMVLDGGRPGSVGRAARPGDIRINDEHGRALPSGGTGYVWLRSPGRPRRYLDDDEASSLTFVDGWVRTGDVGRLDDEHYLYLDDRASDVVKVGGTRVSTLAVESALHEHPGVVDAAVTALRDDEQHDGSGAVPTTSLGAGVVLRPGTGVAEIRRFLAARLPTAEVPTRVVVVDRIRRNAMGKVERAALTELLRQARPERSTPPPPGLPSLVRQAWQDVLGVRDVGLEDDFFLCGGDSLRAARLSALLAERLGLEVPGALAFAAPVLADQVRVLAATATAAPPPGAARPGPAATAATVVPDRPGRAGGSGGGGGALPVSSLQEYFLRWMDQTRPARTVSGITVAVAVREPLDVTTMQAAALELVRRHDVLRSTFPPTGQGRRVRLLGEPDVDVGHVALQGPATGGETLLLACREAELPFDVDHGPLVRLRILSGADDDHLVVLTVHHLVCDGWSMGLLLADLGRVYSALRARGRPPRAPAGPSFRAVTERARERWAVSTPFWDAALSGAPAGFAHVPGRRTATAFRGRSHELTIPASTAAELGGAAAAASVTAPILLTALWAALVAELGHQEDIVLMTPTSGRSGPDEEGVVGCMVQSLLVRLAVSGDDTVGGLARQVRDAAARALRNQHYPYERYSMAVPYPAWVRYERWAAPAHLPGLESVAVPVPRELAFAWPLPGGEVDAGVPELALTEQPDGSIGGALVYNEYAFDDGDVAALAARFAALCRQPWAALERSVTRHLHLSRAALSPDAQEVT